MHFSPPPARCRCDAERCTSIHHTARGRIARKRTHWRADGRGSVEVRDTARVRLLRLVESAVDVVGDALEIRDTHTALAVLRNLALLCPITAGSTSADGIEHEQEAERKLPVRLIE